jgi:pSer/pThr/pTyr-binding forkhead associated (FHA) protein
MDRSAERLALIEVFERDGRAARAVDVARWPLTIGRALDNDLVLDDPHVAAHHARLEPDAEGRIVLTVLETHNGVSLDGRRHRSGAAVVLPAAGATLVLGSGRLRLRLPGESLAPEKPLAALVPGQNLIPLLSALLLVALTLAEHWLALDPGADATAWLPVLVGLPAALAAWCSAWALMSKLFQHRFDFGGHLRIVLPWLAAAELASALLPQIAATLGWPALWQLTSLVLTVLAALLVRAHLEHVLPLHRRAVSAVVAVVVVAGSAISLTLTHRSTDSWTRAPYMSALPLPALDWTAHEPAQTLVQAMSPLAEKLALRVKKAREDAEEDGGDGAGGD